jgi:hypothetical protein
VVNTNQIVGVALLVAGLGDFLAIAVLRRRMPPDRARTFTTALVASATGMIGLGIALLLKG